MKNKNILVFTISIFVLLLGTAFSGSNAGILSTDKVEKIKFDPYIIPTPIPPPPPEPDVGIIKKVWNGTIWADCATFEVGDDIQFKITVSNTGNINLDSYVYVDDDLPSFLTYNYDSNLTPTSASNHHIEWHDLAPLIYNESIEITFTAHADSIGESDNAVAVEAQYDCMPPVDDCDIVHIIVESGGDDDEPPVTLKEYGKPFYTDGLDDWITSDTLIWLNATDNDSGVLHTFYRIFKWDGSKWIIEIDWTLYTGPFYIPTECKHKIEFYSTDVACNTEEIKWQTVFVDNTPPCSWWKITDDPDHYVCRVSTLTIESKDGGPCAVDDHTLYCYVDGNLYKTSHNGKISFQFNEYYGFTEDGRYVVEFWAVDALGNEEDHQIESFFLDTTPPDTDYSFMGPNRWVYNHWQIEQTTKVVFNATDSGSGVKNIIYRLGHSEEGGDWIHYSGPFIPDKQNIYYYSKDNVGNRENLAHLYVEIVETIENQPPLAPDQPDGTNYGNTFTTYSYKTKTTEPEHEKVKYYFSWGDGTGDWTELKYQGQEVTKSHTWTKAGTYEVKVKAQDEHGAESPWSPVFTVYLINENNQPPEKPSKPSGPSSGSPGTEYSYSIVAEDPEDDLINYVVDWGDGTDSGWIGPYESGEIISVKHTYSSKGSYQVKVKARDYYGEESEWSDSLSVSMPRSRLINNPFLLKLFERFPIIKYLFNKIFKI
jgi:uncharacterized repeat protein (TIGR01451 family)